MNVRFARCSIECMYGLPVAGYILGTLTHAHIPQVEVIEMLYCVYQLRVPTWTDSFVDAMASIGMFIRIHHAINLYC